MIKLLLDSDLFIKAEKEGDAGSEKLIGRCKSEPFIQAWTLANTVEVLAGADVSGERIESLLEGISQIPVNALLNERALKSGDAYATGLLSVAAETFKIPVVVSERSSLKKEAPVFINVSDALALNDGDQDGNVNFLDLNLALHPIFNKVDGWFTDIIQNTAFAGGNHVAEFEKEFAEYCGTKHAIGVANGTDALRFALIAMGIGPGDEVITVPNTFIATTEVVSQVGGVPVFVDIDEKSYNIDPELIEEKITERTKLILPVHLYGQIANMERIIEIAAKNNLQVLEDSCQAHGAVLNGKRAGSFGNAAAFSMYPGKNLGAFGEAGCVVTNDPKIDDIVRCLREHGQSKKYYHRMEGYNGRMDNLQAAALRGKLSLLDNWNQQRRQVAQWYFEQLADVDGVICPSVEQMDAHVFHLFVILVENSNGLFEYLKENGIYSGFHYPVPLHQQEAYQQRDQAKGSFLVSEKCADKLLSLPMFPELTRKQVTQVTDAIKAYLARS